MRAIIMLSSIAMGGAERNIVSVAPYIAAQEGVDLRLVTLNTRRDSPLAVEFAQQTQVPRHDLSAKKMVDTAAWRRFKQYLQDEQIDIIHAQDQDTITYAALAHSQLGIPSVMTRHVLYEPTDTLKERARAELVLLAARFGYNRIIAVSEAVRRDFSKLAHVPIDKIETIYNGLPTERFAVSTPKQTLRERFGWHADERIIIMVAVLRRGKGHEVMFEALPKIREAVPNVKLKLVGDGEIADQIREQAAPFADMVEFLGQRSDIAELLHASDVLTLPSWAEALPTVLIEAGAARLPVVATDVGGAKEITLHGETGYIVPAGDSKGLAQYLIEVLQDPTHAQDMGNRAFERVHEMFSLERQAQQTVSLYKRILQS